MGNKILSLFFSLPMTNAMRWQLLDDKVRDWEKMQLPSVDTSAGFILSRDAHKCSKLFPDSNKEGILSIALWELFRTTQIALHCPCHEASSLIFHRMGCRHYFVADRLEDLVDEDDSRSSSRVHEHENFRLVSQLQMAIQTPWNRCLSPRAGGTSVHQRVVPFYLDPHLRLCLCLCLSLKVQQTNWYSRSQERETCIDFLSTRTGRLFCHNKSPCSMNWIRVWLSWLVVFCLSSNFWRQFLHPTISQGNFRRLLRWFIYFLENDSPVSILIAFGIQ